jgi:acyl carrier protein
MATGFDEQSLLADLKSWWDEQVGKDDPFAPPKLPAGTIMDVLPVIDSLATVEALVLIEKYLPFEVPPSVIRPGGYHGFDDMTQDMLPKLQALVDKHAGKQKGKTPTEEEAV